MAENVLLVALFSESYTLEKLGLFDGPSSHLCINLFLIIKNKITVRTKNKNFLNLVPHLLFGM